MAKSMLKGHRLILLKVESKDEFGRPKTCSVLYDEESIKLKGGEEFITVHAPAEAVAGEPPKSAA